MTLAAGAIAPPDAASRLRIFEEREAFWRRLYSTEGGVFKEVYELKSQASEIPLFVYVARCGPNLLLTGAHRATSMGSGVSLDRQAAHDAAIGEALERYCASYVDPAGIVEARRTDLGEDAIDPASLSLFSDAQYASSGFPYRRFTQSTRVAWAVMRRHGDGAQVRVPVQQVYLGYHKRKHVAEICPFISTGLACATEPRLAILKGLYEAVERDAFNIVWLDRLSLPQLDVTGTPDPILRRLLAHFERARLSPSFVLLTLDIAIPIVLCVLRDGTRARPALAVGAAASLDPVRAACKAAEEAAHTRLWTASLRATMETKTYSPDYREVENFDDHVWLFDSHAIAAHADFLSSNPSVVRLESVANGSAGDVTRDLEIAAGRVEEAGFDVLWRDVTTPDVAECGFWVFRTLAPGLQNINGPHASRLLGGRRLYELPVRLGLLEKAPQETDLNPIPHPFP